VPADRLSTAEGAAEGGTMAGPGAPTSGRSDPGVEVAVGRTVGVTGAAWIVTSTGAAFEAERAFGPPQGKPPATTAYIPTDVRAAIRIMATPAQPSRKI
jgi:hypothetical protein